MELQYLVMPAVNGSKGQNKTALTAVFGYVFDQTFAGFGNTICDTGYCSDARS